MNEQAKQAEQTAQPAQAEQTIQMSKAGQTATAQAARKVSYRDIGRFSWHYWGTQKSRLALYMLLAGAGALLDTVLPILAGRLVDALTQAGEPGGIIPPAVLWAFAAFIGLEFFYHPLRNMSVFVFNRFALRNLSRTVNEAFCRVQRFSADWHANAFAGGTVRKITRGMWAFDTYEDIIWMYFYPTAIVLVLIIVWMGVHWPVMGLVTLVAVALYIAVSLWGILLINAPLYRRSAAADTKVGAALADAITANQTVKSFGSEAAEERRFAAVVKNWSDLAYKSWQMAVATDLTRRLCAVLMMAAMIGTALLLWRDGRAGAGDVVYIFTSFMVLSAYLRHVGEQISNLQRAVSEMEDVVTFWQRADEIRDAADAATFRPEAGEIVFDKVRFSYAGQLRPIYDDFSIRIAPGEKVALVGHSGSGKSTFVKLVQRLYDVQSGMIRIDGQDVASVTQASLRKAIALVPQEPVLFHRSLAENIAYSKPGASVGDIIEAAKQAYAHDFIQELPNGYDTLVGERGVKLSGGERQRVAIARAILSDAPILILDEATSSLDSVSEHYIQKALERLVRGRTTITIAHRLATIKAVDRILVFEQGRIVEQGTHAALTTDAHSHYKRLYEMQALDLINEIGQDKE